MRLPPRFRTALIQLPVALFCVWHMFAVGVEAIPDDANDPLSIALHVYARQYTWKYAFLTSQWQQWNLFSPDPTRNSTQYVIDKLNDDGATWEHVFTIDHDTLGWWRSTDELTGLRKLQSSDRAAFLWERYLQEFCTPLHLGTGAILRLTYHEMNEPDPPVSRDWWKTWTPEWNDLPGPTTHCLGSADNTPIYVHSAP